jgi:hypothetical protein
MLSGGEHDRHVGTGRQSAPAALIEAFVGAPPLCRLARHYEMV